MPDPVVSPSDCPPHLRVVEQVPMAHVADVDRSARFYALLGFACESRFADDRGVTNWCALVSHRARLFLARSSGRIAAGEQAVLFYLYSPDVRGLREHLLAHGVADAGPIPWEEGSRPSERALPDGPAAFEVVPRFYMPLGELRVHDPDGYVLLVGQRG